MDFLEEITINSRHEEGGGKMGAIRGRNKAISFFEIVAGAKVLQTKEATHAWGGMRLVKIFLGNGKSSALFLGKIDAAVGFEVVGNIAQDIG